jgi:hypothetical protein
MKEALGLRIPETLEEVCDPQRVALLVYDMQVGILSQIEKPEEITQQVLKVLSAARRRCGARVLLATPLITKKIDGNVSVPDGYGLATHGLARSSESLVFA